MINWMLLRVTKAQSSTGFVPEWSLLGSNLPAAIRYYVRLIPGKRITQKREKTAAACNCTVYRYAFFLSFFHPRPQSDFQANIKKFPLPVMQHFFLSQFLLPLHCFVLDFFHMLACLLILLFWGASEEGSAIFQLLLWFIIQTSKKLIMCIRVFIKPTSKKVIWAASNEN